MQLSKRKLTNKEVREAEVRGERWPCQCERISDTQPLPLSVPLLVQHRLCDPRFCVLECKVFPTPAPHELS